MNWNFVKESVTDGKLNWFLMTLSYEMQVIISSTNKLVTLA